jgi:hypothetical protein
MPFASDLIFRYLFHDLVPLIGVILEEYSGLRDFSLCMEPEESLPCPEDLST